MIKSSCRWRYSRGTSLLEVMIAAVILGVGLLGIAALQMTSLQGSSNAEYRGRASDLAWTLADRMRANLLGLASYSISATTGPNFTLPLTGLTDCDTPVIPACAMVPGAPTPVASCDTGLLKIDIANYDLWETLCSNGVKTALPGGTMAVGVDLTSNPDGPVASIVITWLTRTTDNSAQTLTDRLSMTVMPGTDSGL